MNNNLVTVDLNVQNLQQPPKILTDNTNLVIVDLNIQNLQQPQKILTDNTNPVTVDLNIQIGAVICFIIYVMFLEVLIKMNFRVVPSNNHEVIFLKIFKVANFQLQYSPHFTRPHYTRNPQLRGFLTEYFSSLFFRRFLKLF